MDSANRTVTKSRKCKTCAISTKTSRKRRPDRSVSIMEIDEGLWNAERLLGYDHDAKASLVHSRGYQQSRRSEKGFR